MCHHHTTSCPPVVHVLFTPQQVIPAAKIYNAIEVRIIENGQGSNASC